MSGQVGSLEEQHAVVGPVVHKTVLVLEPTQPAQPLLLLRLEVLQRVLTHHTPLPLNLTLSRHHHTHQPQSLPPALQRHAAEDGEGVRDHEQEVGLGVSAAVAEEAGGRLREVDVVDDLLDFLAGAVDLPDRGHLAAEHSWADARQLLQHFLVVVDREGHGDGLLKQLGLPLEHGQLHIPRHGVLGLLRAHPDEPVARQRRGDALVLPELVPADVGQQVGGLLAGQLSLHELLVLAAPGHRLPLPSSEPQRSLRGGDGDDAVVELDPVRLVGVGRGVDEGEVVAAVVGLSAVHSHAEQHVVLLDARGRALQEAQVDARGVLEVSQDLDQPVAVLPVTVSLEVEEHHLRQLREDPPLRHLHLPVLLRLDTVLHVLLVQQHPQRLAQRPQSVPLVVLQQQVQLVEVLPDRALVGPAAVAGRQQLLPVSQPQLLQLWTGLLQLIQEPQQELVNVLLLTWIREATIGCEKLTSINRSEGGAIRGDVEELNKDAFDGVHEGALAVEVEDGLAQRAQEVEDLERGVHVAGVPLVLDPPELTLPLSLPPHRHLHRQPRLQQLREQLLVHRTRERLRLHAVRLQRTGAIAGLLARWVVQIPCLESVLWPELELPQPQREGESVELREAEDEFSLVGVALAGESILSDPVKVEILQDERLGAEPLALEVRDARLLLAFDEVPEVDVASHQVEPQLQRLPAVRVELPAVDERHALGLLLLRRLHLHVQRVLLRHIITIRSRAPHHPPNPHTNAKNKQPHRPLGITHHPTPSHTITHHTPSHHSWHLWLELLEVLVAAVAVLSHQQHQPKEDDAPGQTVENGGSPAGLGGNRRELDVDGGDKEEDRCDSHTDVPLETPFAVLHNSLESFFLTNDGENLELVCE